jgi:hypothetical protein
MYATFAQTRREGTSLAAFRFEIKAFQDLRTFIPPSVALCTLLNGTHGRTQERMVCQFLMVPDYIYDSSLYKIITAIQQRYRVSRLPLSSAFIVVFGAAFDFRS